MNRPRPEIEPLLRHLDEADSLAGLETRDFLMSQYPKLLRPLARIAARIVLYVAQVVTIRQRHFNRHIVEAVRLLAQVSGNPASTSAETLIGSGEIEERMIRELREFLASDEIIEFPEIAHPEISVLLDLQDRPELTLNCLRSLQRSTFKSLEIVIIDNASSDETAQLLQRIRGARIHRNDQNAHFLPGANQAVKASSAQNLLFLDNKTQLDPYAIEAAMDTLTERQNTGAVGARLIDGTGRLLEAGGVVWRTGSFCSIGRGEAAGSSPFTFRRPTDYVSKAFLLTPRNLFENLGRFDACFSPACCEDVDYCLSLWQKGREVVYEPDALVLQVASRGSPNGGADRESTCIHREKIEQKHKVWLNANHLDEHKSNLLRAAYARYRGRNILCLEDSVPHPEAGSGFPRSQKIFRHLAENGNFVTCYPIRFPHESSLASRSALGHDIEVVSGLGLAGLEGFLQRRSGIYDVLWVSRPHNMEFVAGIRKAHPEWFSGIRVIYDAEAIYCLREIERSRMMGKEVPPEAVKKRVEKELEPARSCDAIAVVSADEKEWCRRLGFQNVHVVSLEYEIPPGIPGFEERSGFVFMGPILEDHFPNADAVERLVRRIFPAIRNTMGSRAQLCLIGYQGSQRIRKMIRENADPQIRVAGQVPRVDTYLRQARVFIAPTRYSSGLPTKILDAAAHGLPVVATSLLAKQLGWHAGSEIMVADSDEEIASASALLHEDEELWTRLRDGAQQRILRDHHPDAFAASLRILLGSNTHA